MSEVCTWMEVTSNDGWTSHSNRRAEEKAVFGSRIGPLAWQIAGGGGRNGPPSAGRVREYPIEARVNRRPWNLIEGSGRKHEHELHDTVAVKVV